MHCTCGVATRDTVSPISPSIASPCWQCTHRGTSQRTSVDAHEGSCREGARLLTSSAMASAGFVRGLGVASAGTAGLSHIPQLPVRYAVHVRCTSSREKRG